MIDYIGDISKADAQVLKEFAEKSASILECGCGASTQVLRAYSKGTVTSVDTERRWITSTKAHLKRLKLGHVDFVLMKNFTPSGMYDLVFNDGHLDGRREFAERVWRCIRVGGSLLYHDTRTTRIVMDVAHLLAGYSSEIHTMIVNKDHSNITVVERKVAEHYENWNLVEGREKWQIGQ